MEDRPGDLDDRAQEFLMALLGSKNASRNRGSKLLSRHRDPITFEAVR
jgi:hypothetical protein